jgi:SAM-dependent methyltransferase
LKKASESRDQGLEVYNGFFPEAPGLSNRKFDVIVFNDSFEHIPDPASVIDGIKRYLADDGGLAVTNLPSSDGIIFRISFALGKLGILFPLDRLWQKGLASPHLHYFNPRNVQRLFKKNGFVQDYSVPLSYYTTGGLWKRVSYNSSILKSIFVWLSLLLFKPLLELRSDVFVSFFVLTKR